MTLGKRGHAGLMLVLGCASINQLLKFDCHLLVVIVKIKKQQHSTTWALMNTDTGYKQPVLSCYAYCMTHSPAPAASV